MQRLVQLFAVLLSYSREVQGSRKMIVLSVIAGAIAGFGSTALLAAINVVLAGQASVRTPVGWVFAGLCLLVPVIGFIGERLLVRLTAQAGHDLRIQLARKILSAPYRQLEEIGAPRLLATLTDDVTTLTTALTNLPLLATQVAVIAGCFIYLGWLSSMLLLGMVAYMALGIFFYKMPMARATRYYRAMREHSDAMFKAIRALIEGTKELKLNRERRGLFQSKQLEPPIAAVRNNQIAGNNLAAAAGKAGQSLFFIFIGFLLFVAPHFGNIDQRVLSGYTLTVLFMISPISMLLNTTPILARAHVAAEKIKSLGLSLSNHSLDMDTASAMPYSWRHLELSEVTHAYRHDTALEEFYLGPLDLSFEPGKLVFLVGGNGSGKTTLIKILMGLYGPQKGEILLDGQVVDASNRDSYRQMFSVVFFDFYLFERLFDLNSPELEQKSRQYLRRLQLDHAVKVVDGELSTTELSQGQRKRLALLSAYLEDRPIYIFDEWASDQDPVFKEVFYHQLLPDLKARGKTVIVISHDDRYYQMADRLIKLERGQIEYDTQSPQLQVSP